MLLRSLFWAMKITATMATMPSAIRAGDDPRSFDRAASPVRSGSCRSYMSQAWQMGDGSAGRAVAESIEDGQGGLGLADRVPHRLDPPRRAGVGPGRRRVLRAARPRSRCRTGRSPQLGLRQPGDLVRASPAARRRRRSPGAAGRPTAAPASIDFARPSAPTHQIGTRGCCTVSPIVGNVGRLRPGSACPRTRTAGRATGR